MQRRRRVEWRDGPVPFDKNRFVSDRNGQRDRSRLVNRFVEGGAVNPDHAPVVVFDLRAFPGLVIVLVRMVRREVAVSDGVLMFVARAGLMDVRGRQC